MNEETVDQVKKSSKKSLKEDTNIEKSKREERRSSSPINTPNSNSPSITREDSRKSSSDSESGDEEKRKERKKAKKRPSRNHSRSRKEDDEIQEVAINAGSGSSSPVLSSSPSTDSLKKHRKEKKEKKSHSTSPSEQSSLNFDSLKGSKEEDGNLKASTDSPAQIPLQNEKSEREKKERREARKLREKSRSDLSKESNAEEKPSDHKSPSSEHRSKSDYPRKSSRADKEDRRHKDGEIKSSKMEITQQGSEETVGLQLRSASSGNESATSRSSVTELRSVKSADNAKEEQGRRNREALQRLSAEDMYHSLPNAKVLRSEKVKEILSIQGPDDKSCWSSEGVENFYNDNIAVKTASTYPHLPGRPFREGDPICDSFSLRVYENRTVIALADGCNWGYRPQEAARRACKAFMEYILANMEQMNDIKECGHYLLRACDKASREIIRDKDDIWEAGTTTLIGGLLLELEDHRWGYVCVSIGDCKALRWSNETKELVDITQGNRKNLTDARDPGGRLGPYLENGVPDLRNLKLYYVECEPDDLLLIVSDGVHDNYDPQQLGRPPSEFGVNTATWEEAETKYPIESETAKNDFRIKLLTKKLLDIESKDGVLYPKNIAQSLIQHCQTTTESSRIWMQENPTKRLPFDCVAFPGKMDHSTAVVIKVGTVADKPSSDPSSKTN